MSRLKRELIEKYRNSGLSVPEFCDREGIHVHTFRSWLYSKHSGKVYRMLTIHPLLQLF
jgi:transposase-like protein